ncbi:MAG TPA: hypothetical protein VHY09_02510 [Candidatus Methylacidiphilales bacterium]|jgi:hypothetical protein|nr:hypothetical protein [Candidatus Methylacidiphilales bacterium]
MVRAVLSIVGIVATIGVLIWCFGVTTPQVTGVMPGLNRSVAHTVGLMQRTSTLDDRDSAGNASGPASAPPGSAPAPQNGPSGPPGNAAYSPPGTAPAPRRSDEAEIISPDSTAYLNPAHVHDINEPESAWAPPTGDLSGAFNPNPPGFAAPHPLPAHPHWTWDIGNREFNDVVVTRVDADRVTIAADSGMAQIDIALLPGEIRRELNYDPVLADQAAAARRAQAANVTTSNR